MGLYPIEPRNEAYVRGKARYPVRQSGAVWKIAFRLVSALTTLSAFLFVLSEFPWQLILVILAPVNAEAHVVDRRATTYGDGAPVYYIVYEYVVNDQRLTNQQRVSQDIYARAEQGTRLRIEYSRIAPNVARIAGAGDPLEPFIALLLLLILVQFVMLVPAIYNEANWRRRIRRAKLIKGQVLQVRTEEREDSDGDPYTATILRVRFQTPQGRI